MSNQFTARRPASWRIYTPIPVVAFLIFTASLPFNMPYFAVAVPHFLAISVYFWATFRPRCLPPAAIFLLGLILDGVTGATPGASSFVMLMLYALAYSQRRVFLGRSFTIGWLGFGVMSLIAAFLAWVTASLLYGLILGPAPIFHQWMMTVISYPALAWLFGLLLRSMPAEE